VAIYMLLFFSCRMWGAKAKSSSLYITVAGFFDFYFPATFSFCKSFIFMFLMKVSVLFLAMKD
jgi:hypothetical protein